MHVLKKKITNLMFLLYYLSVCVLLVNMTIYTCAKPYGLQWKYFTSMNIRIYIMHFKYCPFDIFFTFLFFKGLEPSTTLFGGWSVSCSVS